jgi:hypothetical protein
LKTLRVSSPLLIIVGCKWNPQVAKLSPSLKPKAVKSSESAETAKCVAEKVAAAKEQFSAEQPHSLEFAKSLEPDKLKDRALSAKGSRVESACANLKPLRNSIQE